jgi:hypothetical protein
VRNLEERRDMCRIVKLSTKREGRNGKYLRLQAGSPLLTHNKELKEFNTTNIPRLSTVYIG